MAKEIGGGPKEPGFDGTTVGQIMTPMCPENVQRKNTPTILTYGSVIDKNSPGGPALKTGSKIEGPGQKNKI